MQTFAQYFLTENRNQILTPAFKRWFKNSKVVDKDGRPLVVYHSTNAMILGDPKTKGGYDYQWEPKKNINVFTTGHFGTVNQANQHIYGAEISGEELGPTIFPVYLSIQNPKRVKDVQNNWYSEIIKAEKEGYDGIVYKNDFEPDAEVSDNVTNFDKNSKLIEDIVEKYGLKHGDAFQVMQQLEPIATPEDYNAFSIAIGKTLFGRSVQWRSQRGKAFEAGKYADSWLPFKPNQIKSATGNKGTFNPKSSDIRE